MSGVLERWIENTRKIIRNLNTIEDPRIRLHTLFRDLSTSRDWARPEISLFNGADNAQIKTTLETLTSLRLAFVEGYLTEFGESITDARNGALQACSLSIGLLQLSVAVPQVAFRGSAAAGNTDDSFFESTRRMLDGLFSAGGLHGVDLKLTFTRAPWTANISHLR